VSSSDAGAAAYNPGVQVNGADVVMPEPRTSGQQAYLDAVAADAEKAVTTIEEKLAGMQESLTAAKAAAKQARADAQTEGN
jgi:hypothetical protein